MSVWLKIKKEIKWEINFYAGALIFGGNMENKFIHNYTKKNTDKVEVSYTPVCNGYNKNMVRITMSHPAARASISSLMDYTNVDNLIEVLQEWKKHQQIKKTETRDMYKTLEQKYGVVAACEFARDHIEPLVFED